MYIYIRKVLVFKYLKVNHQQHSFQSTIGVTSPPIIQNGKITKKCPFQNARYVFFSFCTRPRLPKTAVVFSQKTQMIQNFPKLLQIIQFRVLSKLESLLGSNRQLVNGTTCGRWVCPVHDELELVICIFPYWSVHTRQNRDEIFFKTKCPQET